MPNPHLDYLATRLPALREYRLKGSPRPWKEPLNAWLPNNDEAVPVSSGEAPLHLSTFTLIRTIELDAEVWATEAGITGPQPTESILTPLSRLTGENPVAGSWGRQVAGWAADLGHRVRQHLGEVADGQRLKAVCPWCWYQSLVVRVLEMRNGAEPFVRCESGVCAPSPSEVGSWWEGLPCWPMQDWRWLAQRLDQAFEAA